MQHRSSLRTVSFASWLLVTSACVEADYPDEFEGQTGPVTLQDAGPTSFGPPVTAAPDAGVVGSGPGSTLPVDPPDQGMPAGGGNDAGLPPRADSGSGGPVGRPDGGGIGTRDSSVTPDTGTGSAGDAGTETDAEPTGSGLTSCTIMASTDANDAFPYTGKYGCAVWIGNSSNKVVKAFLVATRISTRSGLPTYRSAASGVTVDVVAQATLNAAKQHNYTWDLKDGSKAPVPPGKYTLNVETHSENGTVAVSVPFDTSMGPVSETGSPKGDINSASINCK